MEFQIVIIVYCLLITGLISTTDLIDPLQSSNLTNTTSYGASQECIDDPDATSGCWKSDNYPKPYTLQSGKTFSRSFEPGYTIDVIVQTLDLEIEDYLLIKSGKTEADAGKSMLLTLTLQESKRYRFYNAIFMKFGVKTNDRTNMEIKRRGFFLTWERSGNKTETTTAAPTTTEHVPASDFQYLSVYVTGIEPDHFVPDQLSNFTDMLVKMSNQYCDQRQIPIKESINENDIVISRVDHCPITWPNDHDCINITFAIPVLLNETTNSSTTYELSGEHLEDMWVTSGETMLKTINMNLYKIPNFQVHMILWTLISILILILFTLFIYVLWRYDFFVTEIKKRRLSETNSFYGDKPRMSDVSMNLSPHQMVPPLFDAPKQPLTEDDADLMEFNNHNNFPLYETEDLYFSNPFSKNIECDNAGFINNDEEIIYRHPGDCSVGFERSVISLNDDTQTDSKL